MKLHFPYDKIGGFGIYLSSIVIALIFAFGCVIVMGKPTLWMFVPVIPIAIIEGYLLWNEPEP